MADGMGGGWGVPSELRRSKTDCHSEWSREAFFNKFEAAARKVTRFSRTCGAEPDLSRRAQGPAGETGACQTDKLARTPNLCNLTTRRFRPSEKPKENRRGADSPSGPVPRRSISQKCLPDRNLHVAAELIQPRFLLQPL